MALAAVEESPIRVRIGVAVGFACASLLIGIAIAKLAQIAMLLPVVISFVVVMAIVALLGRHIAHPAIQLTMTVVLGVAGILVTIITVRETPEPTAVTVQPPTAPTNGSDTQRTRVAASDSARPVRGVSLGPTSAPVGQAGTPLVSSRQPLNVEPKSLKLDANQSVELQPSADVEKWVSRDGNIVLVSPRGVVTSVGEGETWVVGRTTAGAYDSVSVEVAFMVAEIRTSPFAEVVVGTRLQLHAIAVDRLGRRLARGITWTSSDQYVEVSRDGAAVAKAPGIATVVAAVGSVRTNVVIHVRPLSEKLISAPSGLPPIPYYGEPRFKSDWIQVQGPYIYYRHELYFAAPCGGNVHAVGSWAGGWTYDGGSVPVECLGNGWLRFDVLNSAIARGSAIGVPQCVNIVSGFYETSRPGAVTWGEHGSRAAPGTRPGQPEYFAINNEGKNDVGFAVVVRGGQRVVELTNRRQDTGELVEDC